MDDDPGRPPPAADGDGDVEGESLAPRNDPEELAGGPVTQNGARPTGEDGGEPAPLLSQIRVADRVDAAVEWVEVAAAEQALELIGRDAGVEELGTGDNSVLASGEIGDRSGRWLTFGAHATPNPSQCGCAPGAPRAGAAGYSGSGSWSGSIAARRLEPIGRPAGRRDGSLR